MRPHPLAHPRYPASRAEKIASSLARNCGVQAIERARQRKRRAETLGHHGQIDLYIAVCAILIDRGGVFSRSRNLPAIAGPLPLNGPRLLAEHGVAPLLPIGDRAILTRAA